MRTLYYYFVNFLDTDRSIAREVFTRGSNYSSQDYSGGGGGGWAC